MEEAQDGGDAEVHVVTPDEVQKNLLSSFASVWWPGQPVLPDAWRQPLVVPGQAVTSAYPPRLRWLLTGFPYSGTAYVAELLTRHGLPCAHEASKIGVRWHDKNGEVRPAMTPVSFDEARAESNGLIGQFALFDLFPTWVKVVHLLRHPVRVISTQTCGTVTAVESAAESWLLSQAATRRRATARCRVECLSEILSAVDLPAMPARFTNTTFNTHVSNMRFKRQLTWADMPHARTRLGQELREAARFYGYSDTEEKLL